MTVDNAHEHVTGRTRPYISRKWLHRGRHRVGVSVDELTNKLNRELCKANPRRWHFDITRKYLCLHDVSITVPRNFDAQRDIVYIEPPEAMLSLPVLDDS